MNHFFQNSCKFCTFQVREEEWPPIWPDGEPHWTYMPHGPALPVPAAVPAAVPASVPAAVPTPVPASVPASDCSCPP